MYTCILHAGLYTTYFYLNFGSKFFFSVHIYIYIIIIDRCNNYLYMFLNDMYMYHLELVLCSTF